MEEKFREIFEKSPIGLIFYDKEGKLTDVNQSALEIVGVSQFEDFKGINLFVNPYFESRKEELLKNGLIKFQTPLDFDIIKESGLYTPTHSGTVFIDYTVSVIDSGFLVQIQDITKQKKAQKVLEESENNFRTILEVYPEGSFLMDPEGNIIIANEFLAKVFNKDADEMVGLNIYDLMPEKVAKRRKAAVKQVIKTKKPLNYVDKRDELYANIYVHPILNEKGKVSKLVVIAEDITERKKAEKLLKESEEKFSKAFYSNSAGMVIATLDGEIIEVNDAYAKLTGYKREELLGHKATDFNILSVEAREEIVKRLFNGDSIFNEEFEIRAKTGEKRQILYTSEFIEFGGEKRGFTIVYDITKRKKAEEELKESESRFRSLYENSSDAILLTKPDGSILAVNPAAEKMFDMIEEEIIKACRAGIVVKNEQLESVLEERAQKGEGKAELTFKRKDGSTFLGETTSSLFTDADGTIKTSMIIRDTTKRRQLEEELRKSRDNLELKVEERTAELEKLVKDLKLKEYLLDSANDSIFLHDLDGNFIYVNDVAYKSRGYTKDKLLSMNIRDLNPPELNKNIGPKIAEIEKHGESIFEQLIYIRMDT